MKIRFAVTLLAVAIAAIGAKAYASAPVIGFIPDVVIGDDLPSTADHTTNPFTFPDALDVNTLATDIDNTATSATIAWSFFDFGTGAITGGNRILINGRSSLDLSTSGDDPVAPAATFKSFDSGDDTLTGQGQDSNLRTITFRDNVLSPISGAKTEPSTTGIQNVETVSLFASDGVDASSQSILIYTDNGGADRLSGAGHTPVPSATVAASSANWTTYAVTSSGYTLPTFTSTTSRLCIQTGLTGNFMGRWTLPYGRVQLKKNAVYRFRMSMSNNGTAIASGAFPLWDFVIENQNAAYTTNYKYLADYFFYDNESSANSVGLATGGRKNFEVWYTPLAVTSASWNSDTTGMFNSAYADKKDMRCYFRVMDIATSAINGNSRLGTLCLEGFSVDTFDANNMVVAKNLVNDTAITADSYHAYSIAGSPSPASGSRTTVTWSNGAATFTPYLGGYYSTQAWNGGEACGIYPGTGLAPADTNTAGIKAWYPIVWESNHLLRASSTVAAPNATAESNPPDLFRICGNSRSWEVFMESYEVSGPDNAGFPTVATPVTLQAFMYTHNKSNTAVTNGARFRFTTQAMCLNYVNSNGIVGVNNGGFTVRNMVVDDIVYPMY